MAQVFSLAQRTTTTTSAKACSELRTSSTTRAAILEMGFTSNGASAEIIGIGRPAAQGVTPVNVLGLGEDSNDTALTNISLSWATSPTVPANFFRRTPMSGTIGVGWLYTFPRGLIVGTSSSLVIWNITTSTAADIYHVWQE